MGSRTRRVEIYYIGVFIQMSNYPVWWDTTITIYNKYEDPQSQVITWYRTVVSNCFWKYAGDKVTINQVTLETDNTICRIPENPAFVEKYLWIKLSSEVKATHFTLGRGDIIVKGAVEDTINEYQDGHRSNDLLAKYKDLQGCIQVQEIALNTGAGRNNPHYYVKGI